MAAQRETSKLLTPKETSDDAAPEGAAGVLSNLNLFFRRMERRLEMSWKVWGLIWLLVCVAASVAVTAGGIDPLNPGKGIWRALNIGWLAVNTVDVILVLGVYITVNLRAPLWCWLATWRTYFILVDFAVVVALWLGILVFGFHSQIGEYFVCYMCAAIMIGRAAGFMALVPEVFAPLAVMTRRTLWSFMFPFLLWMYFLAILGVFCFGFVDDLKPYFGGMLRSMKTVVQIMTFEAVTDVVAAIEDVPAEEQKFCPSWVGVVWVYTDFVVLGFIFSNLLVGVLVDAIQAQSAYLKEVKEQSESRPFRVAGWDADKGELAGQPPPVPTADALLLELRDELEGLRGEQGRQMRAQAKAAEAHAASLAAVLERVDAALDAERQKQKRATAGHTGVEGCLANVGLRRQPAAEITLARGGGGGPT